MSPEDLQAFVGRFLVGGPAAAPTPRPTDRRRPPLEEPVVLTARVDLQRSSPPIWRRLELRSDLSLADLHNALQIAFGWEDRHLHRFSLGGGPFDPAAQQFLCPFDVEDGQDEGIPDRDVRLDEAMQEIGDRLAYLYDYGDSWRLQLKLEKVRPAPEGTLPARAVGGRRAAPPEDCGGLTTAEELAEVLPDPSRFELDALDRTFVEAAEAADARSDLPSDDRPSADPMLLGAGEPSADSGLHPALADIVERLRSSPLAGDLSARLTAVRGAQMPEGDELEEALEPVLWFLDRAQDGGIRLTEAGYMAPAVVVEAADAVPTARSWIGRRNREDQTLPVLLFRETLQSLRLLRKQKGKLLPTRRAATSRADVGRLWEWIEVELIPADGFDRDASAVLLLLAASTPPGGAWDLDAAAEVLTELGWRQGTARDPISASTLREVPAAILLENLAGRGSRDRGTTGVEHGALSGTATALAGCALRREPAGTP